MRSRSPGARCALSPTFGESFNSDPPKKLLPEHIAACLVGDAPQSRLEA